MTSPLVNVTAPVRPRVMLYRYVSTKLLPSGIDVFEREPEVHPALIGLPNVVLAPHIASASSDTRLKMANLAVDNCLAVLEGKTPPTPVNPEVFTKR